MTKVCTQCNTEKQLTEFYKDSKMPGGYRNNCKPCKNKKTAAWRDNNRERYNAKAREHHKKHYTKFRLQRYGLTPDNHNDMIVEQKACCAICDKPQLGKRPLAVDHDHSNGQVRGLLCYKCNRDMHLVDNETQLEKCLQYRNKHRNLKISNKAG